VIKPRFHFQAEQCPGNTLGISPIIGCGLSRTTQHTHKTYAHTNLLVLKMKRAAQELETNLDTVDPVPGTQQAAGDGENSKLPNKRFFRSRVSLLQTGSTGVVG
jgi:hypothetical protein